MILLPGQTVLIWYVVSLFSKNTKLNDVNSLNSGIAFSNMFSPNSLFTPGLSSRRTPPGRPWHSMSVWSSEGCWSEKPVTMCLTLPWCPSSCSLGPTPAPWLWRSSRRVDSSPQQWVMNNISSLTELKLFFKEEWAKSVILQTGRHTEEFQLYWQLKVLQTIDSMGSIQLYASDILFVHQVQNRGVSELSEPTLLTLQT